MAGSRAYRLSPQARIDLEDIWLHTFKYWSLEQAEKYHRDIIATIEALVSGHKNGRRAHIRDGYWKCTAGAHVLYYRYSGTNLDIIRILHGRMDVERHLD